MAIRNTIKKLVLDKVVDALLSKEVKWKVSKSTNGALVIRVNP